MRIAPSGSGSATGGGSRSGQPLLAHSQLWIRGVHQEQQRRPGCWHWPATNEVGDTGSAAGAPSYASMSRAPTRRSERRLEKRIERKGLRPRDAAYAIAAFWAIAVVVFGVGERLLDPKTFHSVWLGMWWAVETVTTVGYSDIVPNQTAGKIIAGFLTLGGPSLIAVVTAAITSGFVSRAEAQRRAAGDDPVT
jgi:Ion channel